LGFDTAHPTGGQNQGPNKIAYSHGHPISERGRGNPSVSPCRKIGVPLKAGRRKTPLQIRKANLETTCGLQFRFQRNWSKSWVS